MKFGKFIQNNSIPEWSSQYMNYKALKKIINALEKRGIESSPLECGGDSSRISNPGTPLSCASPLPRTAEGLKTQFFFRLERELDKVNAFYLQKELELKVRLRSLSDKCNVIVSRGGRRYGSVSLSSIKEAFDQFQEDLSKLQKFVEMNATGFRKILKKWDKRSKSHTKELYLARQIDIQPCFNQETLAELADLTSTEITRLEVLINGAQVDARGLETANSDPVFEPGLELSLLQIVISGNIKSIEEFFRLNSNNLEDDLVDRVFWRLCQKPSVQAELLTALQQIHPINYSFADNVNDRSCLHEAAFSGNLVLVQQCLSNGASTSQQDVYGRKPIHYAAMHGHLDCCKELLGNTRNNIDSIDHDGNTPLLYSVTNGHYDICVLLLDQGASVKSTSFGPDLLFHACSHGFDSIIKILIENGSKLNIPSYEGIYPVHAASRQGFVSTLQIILEYSREEIDRRDKYNGWTPIFYAASEGHEACVEYLIKTGCRMDLVDETGWSPHAYALWNSHLAIANILAENSKPLPQRDQNPKISASSSLDGLPSLELPPPIMPVYGHSYLENKICVQLSFSADGNSTQSAIQLSNSRQDTSVRLVISTSDNLSSHEIPVTLILPSLEAQDFLSFKLDRLKPLEMSIFPTFGTKLIGKAVILAEQLQDIVSNGLSKLCVLPIMDRFLRVVGQLSFRCSIFLPFEHPIMTIHDVGTHWKSTMILPKDQKATVSFSTFASKASFPVSALVTETSLASQYKKFDIYLTKDFKPIISNCPTIKLANMCEIEISNLDYSQARILSQIETLATSFQNLSSGQGALLNICLNDYAANINLQIDAVLREVYENLSACVPNDLHQSDYKFRRSLIFSSYDPFVCQSLNLKQPNFPVFFINCEKMRKRGQSLSLKDSVKFAKDADLFGIMCHAQPFMLFPALIKTVKESGLLLSTFDEPRLSEQNIDQLRRNGVNGFLVGDTYFPG